MKHSWCTHAYNCPDTIKINRIKIYISSLKLAPKKLTRSGIASAQYTYLAKLQQDVELKNTKKLTQIHEMFYVNHDASQVEMHLS